LKNLQLTASDLDPVFFVHLLGH
jgi:hypothetical protein